MNVLQMLKEDQARSARQQAAKLANVKQASYRGIKYQPMDRTVQTCSSCGQTINSNNKNILKYRGQSYVS